MKDYDTHNTNAYVIVDALMHREAESYKALSDFVSERLSLPAALSKWTVPDVLECDTSRSLMSLYLPAFAAILWLMRVNMLNIKKKSTLAVIAAGSANTRANTLHYFMPASFYSCFKNTVIFQP